MTTYLLKTEPADYAWDDLVRDKRTHWDGVTNAAIKADARFSEFVLVKQGHLSAMPGPAAIDKLLRKMAGL